MRITLRNCSPTITAHLEPCLNCLLYWFRHNDCITRLFEHCCKATHRVAQSHTHIRLIHGIVGRHPFSPDGSHWLVGAQWGWQIDSSQDHDGVNPPDLW